VSGLPKDVEYTLYEACWPAPRLHKSGVLVRPRSGKMALRTLAGSGFCKAGNLEKRLSDEIGGLSD